MQRPLNYVKRPEGGAGIFPCYMRLADIYLNGMKNSRKALKTMKSAFVSLRETDASMKTVCV